MTIRGIAVPRRRFTLWTAFYFLAWVGAPVLGCALLLDVALYLLFAHAFESCYLVMCLFR